MLFLNASFSGTPIGASSSSNDGSYYYISLPPGVDEDVAVGVPVRVGCMRRFSQYFNVSFDDLTMRMKSAIFLPDTFYYIVSEKPDFLGPLLNSLLMLAIQAIHQIFLPMQLSVRNYVQRIMQMAVSLFVYVAVVPVSFGVVKFKFFYVERPIAVHDTCLMICAIGYSLAIALPFKLLCLLSEEFYFIGFSLSVFLTFSLMIRVCEKISFKRVDMLPASPDSPDSAKNGAVKCVWLLSCLGFTAYTWTLLV